MSSWCNNQIRVVDEFAGRRPGLFTAYQDFDTSIEIIKFADGTTWDQTDIRQAVGLTLQPINGQLIGTGDIDYLHAGNDVTYMSGGDGGDHYYFGRGDGHVTVDLKIDVLGTNTQVDVAGWFNGGSSQLQEIRAGGLKIDSEVSQLVQAMAAYTASNPGFDPTSSSVSTVPNDPSLQSTMSAAWHA